MNILVPIKLLLYEDALNPHLLATCFEFAVDLSCMKTRTFDILCRFQTAGKSRSSKACVCLNFLEFKQSRSVNNLVCKTDTDFQGLIEFRHRALLRAKGLGLKPAFGDRRWTLMILWNFTQTLQENDGIYQVRSRRFPAEISPFKISLNIPLFYVS
jgi:hypothetical protein